MDLKNEGSNLCYAKNKRKKRNEKNKASCGSNGANNGGGSLMQDVILEKDSCVESTANASSSSGLIEKQSNSSMNCSANRSNRGGKKRKMRKALKAVNMGVELQEVASETNPDPIRIEAPIDVSIKPVSGSDLCVESTGNICSSSGLIEVQSNSSLNISVSKKRKRQKKKRCEAPKADNTDVDLQEVVSKTKNSPFKIEGSVDASIKTVLESVPIEVEVPDDLSKKMDSVAASVEKGAAIDTTMKIKPDPIRIAVPIDVSIKPVSGSDSCVESTGTIHSSSGLIEVQSNSSLNISVSKKKKRQKKKRCKALKADNTDVDLQEVVSETKNSPFKIERLVDASIKTVSESVPIEVEVPDDMSKKMDSVAASIEKGVAVDTIIKIKPNPIRIEAPIDVSIKPVSGRDSCVEPTGNIRPSSGLIEVQSSSSLNISVSKKKKRQKKKRCKALKADNTDVDLQQVVSETKNSPFKIEGSVDASIKTVSESVPIEVEVPDDLSKKMDSVAASVEKGAAVDTNMKIKPDPIRIEVPIDVSIKPVSGSDSFVESTGNICSSSGLIEVQSNSSLNISVNKKKKRQKKKRCKTLKADNTDVDLHQVVSETKNSPFKIEGSVDASIKTVSESVPIELEVPGDLSKKMDSVAPSVEKGAAADTTMKIKPDPIRIEAPIDVSIKPVSRSDSCVESTGNIRSSSGLIEVQSNSSLNISVSKKRKRQKKERCKALKADNTDVDLRQVVSETKNSPFKVEGSVDASIKTVSESVPIEVEVPDDLSKKMDSVDASVEKGAAVDTTMKINPITNLSHLQKKRLRRKNKKHCPNALGHDIDHVHLEDISFTKNTVLEKDTSSLSSADMCSKKQPNGHISLSLEKNEVKELKDGHNDSKNSSTANFDSGNGKQCEKNDMKFVPAAAELTVREDLLVSEKRSNSSKTEDKSLLNEHDVHAGSVNSYSGKRKVKTSSRKKRRGSSGENTSDCIKKDGNGLASFGHSEDVGFSENKLHKELEQKNDASVQVLEDIMMKEVSIDCSDGKPVETKVEEIFPSSSHLGVTKNDVVLDDSGKEDNLLQKSYSSLKRACIGHCKKKLLVLDVNGLLAAIVSDPAHGYNPLKTISGKRVFKRPYCDDFLQFCFERFNVGIWSSRIRRNVDGVLKCLMGDWRSNLLFVWNAYHCRRTGFKTIEDKHKPLVLKELKKLWDKHEPDLPWEKGEYNETNTLLLDDSPYKALCNPAYTAIFPYSYDYKDANDSSLGPGGDIRVYLEGLAAAENVQEYVQQNPFGQQAITESNPHWGFYQKIYTKFSRPRNTSSTF